MDREKTAWRKKNNKKRKKKKQRASGSFTHHRVRTPHPFQIGRETAGRNKMKKTWSRFLRENPPRRRAAREAENAGNGEDFIVLANEEEAFGCPAQQKIYRR